ncbi:MAG TPA: VWA domain-containing protein [Terriglobia bacterium]|nr:VWA domain-containing protein [Terriglobia bacterium]
MAIRRFLLLLLFLGALFNSPGLTATQKRDPSTSSVKVFHVSVDMVQLDVAVTDKKGNYITGLSPWDFAVYEDGIRQKIATFGEENQAPRNLADFQPANSKSKPLATLAANIPQQLSNLASSTVAGASVFILFDTSNYMYRGFVFAQDAIAEFVRSLDPSDKVAFYSYSRDFSRLCPLTADLPMVLQRIRTTVAGDDAGLYDALLLTLKDAGKFSGKRVVVVFSNGPDNASVVSPEDVRELAQSEGIPIYMISTHKAELDPLSTAVFKRVSATTGGKAYFARQWKDQQKAFASIREDLTHLYTLSYYPQSNPNRGWRKITVKLVGVPFKKYHIRTRSGYRPEAVQVASGMTPSS